MKVLMFSLGTRGDVEPFLALAEKFSSKGDEVICSFPVQFQALAQGMNIRFYGLSEKFLELLEGEKAKIVLGGKGSIFQKISAFTWMIRTSQTMQKEVIVQQHDIIEQEQPDLILYNQKCLYPVVYGMKGRVKTTLLSPLPCTIHAFDEHASLGMGGDLGKAANRLTYKFSNFFLFLTIKNSTKRYHNELGLKIRAKDIKRHLLNHEKMIYTVSPCLFPRPAYWPDQAQIVGYYERKRARDWSPSADLEAFVRDNKKIVFITFGSMTHPDPEKTTRDILQVLAEHRIPAIINLASGGLIKPDAYPGHVFFIDQIPYEWIFPKIYAVIHHGGSGTTHTALKHGCASMIIPHILDQHIWNDLIPKLGAGPKGISIKKFTTGHFEMKLLDLLHNSNYKENAERIGNELKKEYLDDLLMKMII